VGSPGSGEGEFETPQGIAVSPKTGDVFVVDAEAGRLEVFSEAGTFIRQFPVGIGEFPWGVAVNGKGDVYVSDMLAVSASIHEYTELGERIATIRPPGPYEEEYEWPAGLAISPSGDVLVARWLHEYVQVFKPGGEFLWQFGTYGSGIGQMYWPIGVAVDASGNVWVAETAFGRVEKWTGAQ
jgi:tripartite motif-containing protein 71